MGWGLGVKADDDERTLAIYNRCQEEKLLHWNRTIHV